MVELKEKMKTYVPKGYIHKTVYIRNVYNTMITLTPNKDELNEIKEINKKYLDTKEEQNRLRKEIQLIETKNPNWENNRRVISDEDQLKMKTLQTELYALVKEERKVYDLLSSKKASLNLTYEGYTEGIGGKYRKNIYNPETKITTETYTKMDRRTMNAKCKNFTIPYKQKYKTLDYKASVISEYSIINLKYYDKITKKTTNKGLTATYIYKSIIRDKHNKSQWEFNGFKMADLEMVCKWNGYIKNKGDQYGHLAEWYIKL
jgi:hypothetical protein